MKSPGACLRQQRLCDPFCENIRPLDRRRRIPGLLFIMPEADPIDRDLSQQDPRANFLPYPASRLAAKIIPQDLTNFKSRGITRVERELQQELVELREAYLKVIDAFNWNKLIYESQFGFEPVVGEVYHLYEIDGRRHLSMIEPASWHQRWIGTFRLNADGRWQAESVAGDFDIRDFVSTAVV